MPWTNLRIGRHTTSHGEYFITFNTQSRINYFHDYELAMLFCRQLAGHEKTCNCEWLTWVLMPDHFHGLLRLNSSSMELAKVIAILKGNSALALNRKLNKGGKFWQKSFYDRALRAEDDRVKVARYIVANPVRKGLVTSVKQYPFWDSVYL